MARRPVTMTALGAAGGANEAPVQVGYPSPGRACVTKGKGTDTLRVCESPTCTEEYSVWTKQDYGRVPGYAGIAENPTIGP